MYFTTAQSFPFPSITSRAGERLAAIVMLAAMLIQMVAPILLPVALDQAAPAASAPAAAVPVVRPVTPGVDAARGLNGAPPTVWTPVRPAPSYPLPSELAGKREIAALRSSNGAVFDLGAGNYAQLQDMQPLHYQDKDGTWQVIAPTFAAVDKGWANSTNTVRTSLAASAAYAEVGTADVGIAWEPRGIEVSDPGGKTQPVAGLLPAGEAQHGTLSADGRTVRYTASWTGGIQDQWQIDRGRAEYSLRLPELPQIAPGARGEDATLDLHVRLHLNSGTQILVDGQPAALPLTTAKTVEFQGTNGETLQLLPPYAFEQINFANGTGGEYTIASADAGTGALDLRLRIPWHWLAAPERQYPVILDPRFQMRSSTEAATARYNPLTLQFQDVVLGGASNLLGRSKDYANRMLVRFDMPFIPAPLPVISKAWLLAAPSAVDRDARYAAAGNVTVHTVNNSMGQDWWSATSIEPAFDLNQPLPPGPQLMGLVKGASVHPVTRWDITNQVRGWLPNASTGQEFNMGLILRASNEQCLHGFSLDPLCGAMLFSETASNWTQTDLNETQYASTPDSPYTPASESSGLRLLVFYTAAALNPNQVLTFRPISKQALPPGTDPVWNFDHVYNLPAIATDRWRAMVARGFGPVVETPLAQYPGKTMRRTPLAGGVPLTVRTDSDDDGAGYIDWRIATPNKGQATYVLVNGRGTSNITPPGFQLHVGATTDAVQPEGYDVRLINELSTLQTTLPVQGDPQAHKRTIRYAFDSGDPLAIWNLDLPSGSNTEISITVDKDGTVPMSFMGFANNFSAQVIHSTTRLSYPDGSGLGATNRWPLERVGLQPVVIGTDTRPRQFFLDFQPQAGQSALVLAYNGPRVDTFEVPDICLDELCNRPPAQEMRVKFEMTINIISCPAGSYPDADGNCREVRCPTTSMPAGSIQDAGSFRLWSSAGWTPANAQAATSNSVGPAPLIGTAVGGPRVAIIGNVTYDKAASEVTTSANSKAILISCPPPAASPALPTAAFVAGRGAMERQLLTQTKAVLRFTNITNTRPNPWADPDRSDLLNADYYVDPAAGTAVGTAELRRRTGEAPDFRDLKFAVNWSWNAQGWASFVGNAAAMANNPQPPAIASLALGLGSSFALDMQPQQGNGYRTFAALRATQATITQPVELGGASRPVQALVLPRNQYVPSDPLISCAASCIDLRALDDTVSAPNRTWQMPDVHVVAAAGTVMMSAPGMLQVNSIDHPNIDPARAADFAQEYSFDAYKASVSVQQEWCTQEDQQQNNPKVLVVRGETRMALPNIGDSGASPDAAIAASFKLCSSSLRGVHMEFYSPVGVPIGTSGLFLTGLNGSVDIYPEHTRITMGLRFQAAQGGDGGVFTATGEVTIDTLGLFAFQGSAEILGVVDANGKVWVAWNPLDTGFEVTAHVGSWLSGGLRAHMWEGTGVEQPLHLAARQQ